MRIIEVLILVLAILLTLGWMYGMRTYMEESKGVTKQTATTTMFFVISILFVLLTNLSELHLLWMFPVSWLLGSLTIILPFSLFWMLSRWFVAFCCIGISSNGIEPNEQGKKQEK